MVTFNDLVDDVKLVLEGYGVNQDQATWLTGSIGSTDTTASCDVTYVSAGVAEVEDELVYIQSTSGVGTGTVTFAPDGRGYRGTVAATHASGTRMTMNPTVPRTLIKRKINETINGLWPSLYGIGTTTITWNPVVVGYALPADFEDMLQITQQEVGPSNAWLPIRRYHVDMAPDTTQFPTGRSINVYDSLWPVKNIQVQYKKKPVELTNGTDDLVAVSGLRSTARGVIVSGTLWRLASFMDLARLRASNPAIDQIDERNPVGAGTQIASYLRKQYETELRDEQTRMQVDTPPTIYWQD